MTIIRLVAPTVLCVCMAATASASAHLFHAARSPGTLLGHALGNQVFVPFSGAGSVTCTNAATTGSITEALSLHQLASVFYSGCTAFTFGNVDISTAKYLLSADGLVAIENTISINVLGVCNITVKPQDLGTVKYDNNVAELIELSAVGGIKSEGSGGACGTANTGGTYTGENLLLDLGGALSWS